MPWLSKEEFEDIFSKVPRLNVEVIVKTPEGIVLSFRDIKPWKDVWHIPGGTVYHGELLEDAVKRVAKNELGVEVKVIKQLGVVEYPSSVEQNYFGWPVGIIYLVEIESGKLTGSEQGKRVEIFKKIPEQIVPEQRELLIKYDLAEA